MLFTMLNNILPFNVSKKHRKESLRQMKQIEYTTNRRAWDDVSDLCKDLVDSMFTYIPKKRPNIVAVRNHAWFDR